MVACVDGTSNFGVDWHSDQAWWIRSHLLLASSSNIFASELQSALIIPKIAFSSVRWNQFTSSETNIIPSCVASQMVFGE